MGKDPGVSQQGGGSLAGVRRETPSADVFTSTTPLSSSRVTFSFFDGLQGAGAAGEHLPSKGEFIFVDSFFDMGMGLLWEHAFRPGAP